MKTSLLLLLLSSYQLIHAQLTFPKHGDPLVADSQFIMRINETCIGYRGKCVFDDLNTNYNSFFESLKPDTYLPLLDQFDLGLRLIKRNQKMDTLAGIIAYFEVYLVSFINEKEVDSVICYQYSNWPDNGMANEVLYYLDSSLQLHRVFLSYEVNSVILDEWDTIRIDPKTGLMTRKAIVIKK